MLLFTIFIIYWGHRCILNYPAGDLHSIKGAIGEPLRSPWEALGGPWGALGEPLGALGEPLGALWEPLGALESPSGALESPWGALESPWGALGSPALGSSWGSSSWKPLGIELLGGASGEPLGRHWGDIG
jgi:hypothetical protein